MSADAFARILVALAMLIVALPMGIDVVKEWITTMRDVRSIHKSNSAEGANDRGRDGS